MFKKYNKIIIFIIFFIVSSRIFAQPPPPPDPDPVPISGGVIGLLVIGLGYAINKLRNKE